LKPHQLLSETGRVLRRSQSLNIFQSPLWEPRSRLKITCSGFELLGPISIVVLSSSRLNVIPFANSTKPCTSFQFEPSPKLTRTTPSSAPIFSSSCIRVVEASALLMYVLRGKWDSRSAAAPPELHMQPVRREMLWRAESVLILESGIGEPFAYK
jgi:hypothetical protein